MSCIQEEAKKQTEAMATQLNSKSSQLLAKEKELTETQQRLEAQVRVLDERLLSSGKEFESAENKMKEVCMRHFKVKLSCIFHFSVGIKYSFCVFHRNCLLWPILRRI